MDNIAAALVHIRRPTFILGHRVWIRDPSRPVAEDLRGSFVAANNDRAALVDLIPCVKFGDGYRLDPDYSIIWLCPRDALEGAELMLQMYRKQLGGREFCDEAVSRFWRQVVFRCVAMIEPEMPIDLEGDVDDLEDEFRSFDAERVICTMAVELEHLVSEELAPVDRPAFFRVMVDLWDSEQAYRIPGQFRVQ